MKHVIVKQRKINSVASNMAYLQNKKEHPEICYTYSTCSKKLWKEYAAVNQEEFRKSGKNDGEHRCVEARETIYVYPEEFYNLNRETLQASLRILAKQFKRIYGSEVMIAMHGSDQESKNLHIHVMYMERQQVAKHEKVATRRLYFDDRGRQLKSRKDALDESGNMKEGYSFVRKGETYGGVKEWTAKDQKLHSNQFTRQLKIWWANQMNKQRNKDWAEGMEERKLYDRDKSPYLPLQDNYRPLRYSDKEKQLESIQTAQELSEDIKYSNDLRKEYNALVDQALNKGADLQELVNQRKKLSREIQEALNRSQKMEIDNMILRSIAWIDNLIRKIKSVNSSLADKIQNASSKRKPLAVKTKKGKEIRKKEMDRS